ncbi:sugar-binding transcriptional regulator [Pseudarthrobacter sp. GA104]|uniref:sugar-binding transcriptional regulator n=1 Tax=Pseudarthrobacter sp. GA104 TaxID=2676311 RepID=UPI0012FB59C3|nr:sugar-binding domain-containing protein [Pseudarthrobacter sp. GA104]MUU70580.1 MarR family transcriptional regulator [Pseudarthrobacter sp. GA104]
MTDVDGQRLMIKVARLYHTHEMRQTDIAKRLQISQSRVSRLLAQAEDASIVRTVVAVPQHVHAELEERIESIYGLSEVHIVDAVSDDETELGKDLAHTMAALLHDVAFEVHTIALTSWSKTMRLMIDVMLPMRTRCKHVIETLGDLGPPALQHDTARSTQQFAALTGAQPVFLRTPGVAASPEMKDLLLSRDPHAQKALEMLDSVDLALVGIGADEIDPDLRPGDNFFTDEQYAHVRELGAVGEVCLHFLDADGNPIDSELEDLVVGITREQLKSARHRWAVAGGTRKHRAIRAAVAGGWVDTLVTDSATAQFLVDSAPAALQGARETPPAKGNTRRRMSASKA